MVQRLGHYGRMSKKDEGFEMWIWRRMENLKWTYKIKKCGCARKSGRKENNAGTDKEDERNWQGHWLRRNCLLEGALEGMVNGKKVRGKRRY